MNKPRKPGKNKSVLQFQYNYRRERLLVDCADICAWITQNNPTMGRTFFDKYRPIEKEVEDALQYSDQRRPQEPQFPTPHTKSTQPSIKKSDPTTPAPTPTSLIKELTN